MKKTIHKGRPRLEKSWNSTLLAARANEYFEKCDSRTKEVPVPKVGLVEVSHPEPYTLEGLCEYLQICTKTFRNWQSREDALGERARLIFNRITANRVVGALDGSQNSSFAQFLLKNTNPEEYRDKVEVENGVDPALAAVLERSLASWKIE